MKKTLILAVLFLSGAALYAQPSGAGELFVPQIVEGGKAVTLREAVAIALKDNTSVRNAMITRDVYKAQINEYKSYLYPTLSLSGTFTHNIERPAFIIGGSKVTVGQANAYNAGLDASWLLWSGGQVRAGVKIAKNAELTGDYNLQSVRDDIERQVKDMAYLIFLSNAVVKVQEGYLDIAKQNLQEIKLKYKEGLSSNLDLLSQEVSVANIEPQVIKARNSYELGTLYLKRLLNKDPEDNIFLIWNDFNVIKEPKPLEELYALAAANRPDLTLSRLNVDIAKEWVTVARAGNFPTVSAFGTKYYNAQTNGGLPGGNDYYWTSTVGLRVSMPLFEGFRVKAQVDQKELAYEQARRNDEDLQRAVRISIKSAWLNFYEARKRMGSGDTVIQQSRQNLESMRKRYRAGLASRLELDDAAVALANAQLQYVQAVHDALVALSDLRFNVGTEVIK
ncbi:hypothetical protein FACS189437_01120 [Bacteroidia bacterium]|nr:hypothetical protein FACS189437_01120 [Bacteroidia bacterium]